MSLPCHGCGAQTNLGCRPWTFAHRCLVALNLNLGIEHQRNAVGHISPQFWVPAAEDLAARAAAELRDLGAFLARVDQGAGDDERSFNSLL